MTEERLNEFEASNKADGHPVKVVMLVDANRSLNAPQDDLIAGAQAAVSTINNHLGGLGRSGNPIQLEVFETDLDSDRTEELTRQAVADPECVALVGGLTMSFPISEIIEQGSLASIPAVPSTKGEYYSPVVFNVNGGHIVMDGGKIDIAYRAGAKCPGSLTTNIPGIPWFADVHNLTLKRFGLPEETVLVAAPYNVDDITPWVKKSAGQNDAIMMTLVNNQDTANAILVRKELCITIPVIVEGMALSPEFLKELGTAGDGILVASLFPASDSNVPGQQCYVKSMLDSGVGHYLGDKSQMSWMSFDLLHYALKNSETVTRESVLAALRRVSDYTGGGITPQLNFTEPSGPSEAYPRLYNWTYYPTKIENGKIVSAGKPGVWAVLPVDIPKSDAPWETPSDEDAMDDDMSGISGERMGSSSGLVGNWDAALDSPMGRISIVFTFTETPDGVQGSAVTGGEDVSLTQLLIKSGDGGSEYVSWEAEVDKPLKLHLRFSMTIHENRMEGRANAGIFLRNAKVTGTRR